MSPASTAAKQAALLGELRKVEQAFAVEFVANAAVSCRPYDQHNILRWDHEKKALLFNATELERLNLAGLNAVADHAAELVRAHAHAVEKLHAETESAIGKVRALLMLLRSGR